MQAIAKARFQRISPRKARIVLNLVRGKNVAEALDQLRYTKKAAAPMVAKVIDSAIANAQHRAEQLSESVNLDNLVIPTAFADKAPDRHMRRYRPRAQGRATKIVKGMSHITIIVQEKDAAQSSAETTAAGSEEE